MMEWYEVIDHKSILSPALLFYPDRIKENIQQMISIAGTPDRLRPHIKTYKCAEIVKMQLNNGIKKFKCATLSEAQLLAEVSVPDVLIAYPLVGPNQQKYIELIEQFPKTKFSTLVDNLKQINMWNSFSHIPINIFIDILMLE
ncbi:alanine racemase [Urechidicola croceus]|uniref:alanine racemase n=1 Tax=Urechidicola croceus TaxID=1850246 RepID=UPI0009F1CBB8|nr:alanine racemase [Urechidicola croceus]